MEKDFEIIVIDLLKEIIKGFHQFMNDFYNPYSLTQPQAAVLHEVYKNGPQNITDLCRQLGVNKSNLSPICTRLEKLGLIQKVRDREDQRIVYIQTTDKGRKSIEEVIKNISETYITEKINLTEEEKQTILQGLKLLNRCISEKNNLGE